MRQRSIFSVCTPLLRGLGVASLLLAPAMGCVIDNRTGGDAGGDGNSGGGGGASEQNISGCKDACNQLKFFDCNDADEHASCFSVCEQADDDSIELFVACVQTDVCDPDCIDALVSEVDVPDDNEGGDGCVAACNDYVADGCMEPVDCGAVCSLLSADERNFIVYCEARRMQCELPAECDEALGEPEPEAECYEGCDSMHFFDCLSAQQHADCRSLCTTVDEQTRDTFAACAGDGICSDSSCYDVMAG